MPKIPIIRPPEYRDRSAGLGDGPEPLSPEQADALKAVEDRTARIDRELAVSQIWRAGVERLADADKTPGGAPVGFTRSFLDDLDRERQQRVTALPPAAQEPLERDLLDLRTDFLDRAAQVEASGMALRRRTALYAALDGYVAGVTRDPGQLDRAAGRMTSLIAELGLPEARQGPMRLFVRDVLGNAAVDGLMRNPARAERVLSDGLYDDVLSASSKAQRLKEAQDKVARDARLARERAIADLTAQARDGAASDEAIVDAERKRTLSPADAAYLRQANAAAAEAATLRATRIRRVATASGPFDPSNPEDRAAVSAYWDSVAEVYASDDPKAQQEKELRFVERTGVLPKSLESKYRGALLSRDAAVVVQGATAIARLSSADPALVQDIPADEVGRAQAIARYASLGVEPDTAIERGDKKVSDENLPAPRATNPHEIQLAANDEPPVMSDATERGEVAESRFRSDGSAILVDREDGREIEIDPDKAALLEKYTRAEVTIEALHDDFLRYYILVHSGKITRQRATENLRFLIGRADEAIGQDIELGKKLWLYADGIFDEVDFHAAERTTLSQFILPKTEKEIGKLLLSVIPIVGQVYNAIEAYKGFKAAIEAWQRGDTQTALREGGMAALSTIAMLPGVGVIPRLGRLGVKSMLLTDEFLRIRRRWQSVSIGDFPQSSNAGQGSYNRELIGEPDQNRVDPTQSLDEHRIVTRRSRLSERGRPPDNRKSRKEWMHAYDEDWERDPVTGHHLDFHHPDAIGDGGFPHYSNGIPVSKMDHIDIHRLYGDYGRWQRRRGNNDKKNP